MPHPMRAMLLLALLAAVAANSWSPADDLIKVDGARILSPRNAREYGQAQLLYWRTVLSLPERNNPLNPSSTTGCPKAIQYGNLKDDAYLITSGLILGNGVFKRRCSIPANTPVILNIYDDFEWYSPPLDYTNSAFSGQNLTDIRLDLTSLSSIAQAVSSTLDPTTCLFATINGKDVMDIGSFYHVSPPVNNMNISPGFYQTLEALFSSAVPEFNTPEARRLLASGIRNTDFAEAGYYLVFPAGLKPGEYMIEFGIRKGCVTTPQQWWRKGVNTTTGDCFPNAMTCGGDLATYTNTAITSDTEVTWSYSIHVQ